MKTVENGQKRLKTVKNGKKRLKTIFPLSEFPSFLVYQFQSFKVSKLPSNQVTKLPSSQVQIHHSQGDWLTEEDLQKNCMRWHNTQTTDGHHNFETEWADSVKFHK